MAAKPPKQTEWKHHHIMRDKKSEVLYNLPSIAGAETVYIVKGEKAADAINSLGLIATTSQGSSAPRHSDWSPLAGKKVVILPDNEAEKYKTAVIEQLAKLDPQPTVKVVALPDLPKDGDADDWIEQNDGKMLEQLREWLQLLVSEADALREELDTANLVNKPVIVSMADIEPRTVNWLWRNRIARGRITVLGGIPGLGKSFITCDIAARISTGRDWPDGSTCEVGSVIIANAEDDPRDTIRPRLDAHGANVHRVKLLSGIRHEDDQEHCFTLQHLDALEHALRSTPDCRLVVVDPIGSYLGGGTDSFRDNEVRSVLAPVAKLAERYGCAVLVVSHRRKGNAGSADDAIMGSRAFTGIARTVWHLTQDKEDESRRLFLAGKNNLAKAQTGLAFTIDGDPGSVRWESAPVTITADEAMADERRDNDGTTKLDEAKQWLKHRLENGPAPSNEIKVMARRDGITMKTLERAKKPLDVQSYPEEFGGKWMLALPQSSPTTTEFAIDKTMAETDELGGDCKTSHQLEEGF